MSEAYVSLYGDDAEEFHQFRERLDAELPGGVDSNAATVRAALDLAEDALDRSE
jgi:uncharacterized protein YeaO (DUF488 family)